MPSADEILGQARTVLLVDWPSREVPHSLVRAGLTVYVRGGPGPEDYSVYEARGEDIVSRPAKPAPAHADVVYCHRPIGEMAGIVALARTVGAATVWWQSGLAGPAATDPRGCWAADDEARRARELVESAGLVYLDQPYIADVARSLGRPAGG